MYIYLFLICLVVKYASTQEAPTVTTTQGLVTGLTSEDGGYYMYLGIPYGLVDPLNPFGASSPHPPFEDTFDAVDDSAICPQVEEFNNTITGSLDCLHLNVFVPRNTENTPKAVLVWLYGGRFIIGFYGRFLFGPKYLTRHDIILVTVNYRLGPYGFMCTDSPRVPGNQGLKDQELALKWIKNNIANFGGDPNRITLNGNSAGAMSTDFHVLKNHQPKLFNQIILQSGNTLCPSFPSPDKSAPFLLAKHFGLDTDDIDVALDFITAIDPLQIIAANEVIRIAFRPCIERDDLGVETFMSYNWVANDSVPLAKELNMIVGYNNDESLSSFLTEGADFENSISTSLDGTFDMNHEEFTGEEIVRQYFFGDEDLSDYPQDNGDIRSDMSFIHPAFRIADKYIRNHANKVYMYKFSYSGGRNFMKIRRNITEGGAFHIDEIGYLFDIEFMEEPTTEDQLVLDRMTVMWANFAKYGDPTPQTSTLLPVRWEPITPTHYNYIDIGAELAVGTRPFNYRITFWDLFFEQYGHLQRFLLNDQRIVKKWHFEEIIP